ncbi:hypothetical protein GCM10011579_034920 [Streptomyces albiflavescens]|uniref:Transposase n=1 Tax=Streptomyces albiflavescens TaxID=1623582 RepID=A0A917Y2D0_9ACTN|nr:transposase [Streptomyces albiflavescens]GGN64941.1 hypothetical protein GCM10011579_034920 [Streptomyces albiflavescens]
MVLASTKRMGFLPLTEGEIAQLKAVRAACPELEKAHQPVRDFGQMRTLRTSAVLPDRINDARTVQPPGITGCARGLTCDLEAVAAGLTLPWNSGGTEGAVNRMKRVKRQLYGRVGCELLRKMILLQCPSATAPQDLRQSRSAAPGNGVNWPLGCGCCRDRASA